MSSSTSSASGDSFGVPEPSGNITDFGFDYTNSVSRIRNPHETNTSRPRTRSSIAERRIVSTARKSTSRLQRPANTTNRRPRKTRPLSKEQRERRLLNEIFRLRNCTDNMIPKFPFARLVKEIVYKYSDSVNRITPEALSGLQEAAEMYLAEVFEDAYTLTLHRERVTLMPKDMILLMFLRNTL